MTSESFAELRKFISPEIVFGAGARGMVGRYAANLQAKKALVVSDKTIAGLCWFQDVLASLEEWKVPFEIFTDVTPNPRVEEVMTGSEFFRSRGCDCIVALGGGSAMDCAKGIGVVSTNGGHILDYVGLDKVNTSCPPMIFIPTTAGSSADVSQFAIFTDLQAKNKVGVISKGLVPDIALVDPDCLSSLEPDIAAAAGVDALVHAIEAFVSVANSPLTDVHALNAIELLGRSLPGFINHSDPALQSRVMQASLEAGLAFSNAILGAVHACAHAVGGLSDAAHGLCNAALLEHVVDFNYPAAAERYEIIGKRLGVSVENISPSARKEAIVERIKEFKVEVGIPQRLRDFGLKGDDIPALVARALTDPCLLTNPRLATARDLEVIYERAI